MRIFAALCLLTLALPALAQEGPVPLPKPRPAETTEPTVKLPRPRPDPEAAKAMAATPKNPAVPKTPMVARLPADPTKHIEPETVPEDVPAPPKVYQSACPAVISGEVEAKMLPPIAEKQCVAQSPFALTGVMANGRMVPISGGVTTSCGIASALPAWVASIDAYLAAKENTRIETVIAGTSYMCRNVNNGSEGNLSFHAFAEAIDVAGFKLEDGRTVTVEGGWTNAFSPEGRLLRFAHDSACAQFTTTLGPEANELHYDHFHLDLGCHGKTCTARLCE